MKIRVTMLTENDKELTIPKEEIEAKAKEAWEAYAALINISGKDKCTIERCELVEDEPKIEPYDEIMESKRDGFFECSMTDCRYSVKGKCANSCYVDCPYYSLRESLRELVRKYEEIVVQL